MLIEKAYCIDLDKIVTAYEAREVFFSDENGVDKFYFRCASACCGIELYAVNLYTHAKIKQRPHFRGKPKSEHAKHCDWFLHDIPDIDNKGKSKSCSYGLKRSPFPSELVSRRAGKPFKITVT